MSKCERCQEQHPIYELDDNDNPCVVDWECAAGYGDTVEDSGSCDKFKEAI